MMADGRYLKNCIFFELHFYATI